MQRDHRAVRRGGLGQSLVEFTLALPVFLLVLLGIAEGGYYVVATTAVSNATQEAARLGVLGSTPDIAAIKARLEDAASVVVGIADSQISVELNGSACDDACYGGRQPGDRLTVITTYEHRPILSYVFNGVTFQNDASAELVVE